MSNVAVAFATDKATMSEPCMPSRMAEPVSKRLVASVLALYTRLFAVIPATVKVLRVIDAEVLG